MPELEAAFQKAINDIGYFHDRYYSGLYIPLHKFTMELIYNERVIPDKYIIPENKILHQFPKIYKKLTERGHTSTVIKMLNMKRNNYTDNNIDFVMRGAAKVGNIKFLRHLHQNGFKICRRTTGAAAKAGRFKTLKWLIKHGVKLDIYIVSDAAVGGNMEILKFLVIDKKCAIDNASFFAASKGQFDAVKFLYSIDPKSLGCAISGAARGGYLEILKYAFDCSYKIRGEHFWCEHLHIWEWLIENNHFKYNADSIENIAWSGNLESLQYVHSKGYDVLNKKVFKKAICGRNVEMVQWLHDMCPEKMLSKKSAIDAALNIPSEEDCTGGSLPILKLLVSWGYDLIDSDCSTPAHNGDLDILQYQYEHGCKIDKDVINNAAAGGHLHVIIWCRKQGCNWSADTCKKTVVWNHLHVLKWLRGIDRDKCEIESDETEICPWDERVCIEAITRNHIDVLEFALENGCDFGDGCCAAVLKSKDPAIIDCVDNYYAYLQPKIMNQNI